MQRKNVLLLCSALALSVLHTFSFAQSPGRKDTLAMTLEQAEKTFLEKNLQLIAGKFSIDESKALEIQAKVWDNPNLYVEQSIYNKTGNRYFPTQSNYSDGTQGENIVNFNQLFLLAGKRNKRLQLAKINTEVAEYTFYDLLRTLKYTLHSGFFELYFQEKSLTVYDTEIESLQKTVGLYQMQFDRGNIPLKEIIRLKAFLYDLRNQRKDLASDIADNTSELLTLLGDTTSTYLVPVIAQKQNLDSLKLNDLRLSELGSMALQNRYDLKSVEAQSRYEVKNLSYQRALGVPDLTVGFNYDRNGSYISDYTALNMQMPIPLFNRNQGNIKAAKARVKAGEANLGNYRVQVERDVLQAYRKVLETDRLFRSSDNTFIGSYDKLMEGITSNFQKRNIGIVEYLDYYEAYKNAIIQLNRLQSDRINAVEELNYSVGKNIVNY